MQHSVRNSFIDAEQVFDLQETALCWRRAGADAGDQQTLSYADIKSIKLISYPGSGGMQCQCTIKPHKGRTLKIRSHHFAGLNYFISRAESYAPFVRGLCQRVANANGDTVFWAGSTAMWIVYLVLVVLMAAVAIAGVAALWQGSGAVAGAAGALFAMTLFAGSIWALVRKGKGRPFDPEDPPEYLLG